MVVERQLAAQGVSRHDIGREQFINKVWQWKEESGGTITRQLRRIVAGRQHIHRDEDAWPHMPPVRPQLQVEAMFALTGQRFSSSKEARAWAKENGRKAGIK